MMTPRLGHTTCLVRQRLLIFGGSLKGSALDNDLYEFNPSAWRRATVCVQCVGLTRVCALLCNSLWRLHVAEAARARRPPLPALRPHVNGALWGPEGGPAHMCSPADPPPQVVEGVRPKMFVVGGLGAPRGKPELLNDVFVYDVGALLRCRSCPPLSPTLTGPHRDHDVV